MQPVHSEGDQPWDFFGRNDAKAESPVLCPPHVKSWLIGKDSDAGRDWGQEEKGTTEDETAGWHHWLDGRESQLTPGVGDRQGGLACCDSWGRKESDTTEWQNWTELNSCSNTFWHHCKWPSSSQINSLYTNSYFKVLFWGNPKAIQWYGLSPGHIKPCLSPEPVTSHDAKLFSSRYMAPHDLHILTNLHVSVPDVIIFMIWNISEQTCDVSCSLFWK